MNNMQFVELVALVKRESKGEATSEELDFLNEPQNIHAWKTALEAAIEDCLVQFDDWEDRIDRVRKDVKAGLMSTDGYENFMASYEPWKKKASRYRLGLEQKLLEISLTEDDRDPIIDTLVEAIVSHKDELGNKRVATTADQRLWSLVDNLR